MEPPEEPPILDRDGKRLIKPKVRRGVTSIQYQPASQEDRDFDWTSAFQRERSASSQQVTSNQTTSTQHRNLDWPSYPRETDSSNVRFSNLPVMRLAGKEVIKVTDPLTKKRYEYEREEGHYPVKHNSVTCYE